MFSLVVKVLMSPIRVPGFDSQFQLLIPASYCCGSWEAVAIVQVSGFLLPTCGTCMEFLGLAQATVGAGGMKY